MGGEVSIMKKFKKRIIYSTGYSSYQCNSDEDLFLILIRNITNYMRGNGCIFYVLVPCQQGTFMCNGNRSFRYVTI